MNADVDALLRFVSRLQRLESFARTGWVVSGVQRPESVSAHAYEVTLLALWIAESIPEEVDTERVLRIALLHDVGEAITTDIPGPVKEMIGRIAVDAAEARAADTMLKDAPTDWARHASAYREEDSLEVRVVKSADRLQMLARALAYERSGNGDTRRFWEREYDDFGIPYVRRLLDALRERHDDRDWFAPDFD